MSLYIAWVTDSEGTKLYSTPLCESRQKAIDLAWEKNPDARSVASGKGINGWEDIEFQTAIARRIETGAPEPQ